MDSSAASAPQDDVSLVVVLLDTNPFFWGRKNDKNSQEPDASPLTFAQFLEHAFAFFNSILLLHQLNHLVVIGTGMNTCEFIYDSTTKVKELKGFNEFMTPSTLISQNLEEFVKKDHELYKNNTEMKNMYSLLSASMSMALCYIQRVIRSTNPHPQPRILCLQGSPDGPQQHVGVMNAIFSAQRSMIPIDACIVGSEHSAFLQQASHITGGIYLKPQFVQGLFQFLAMVFATDLHSRRFLQLPRPTGVDFRASCFCHKKAIDMGYVCSVCLSIFCEPLKKCSTCESVFNKQFISTK